MLGKPDSLHELVLVTQRYNNLYWERQEEWKLARQRDNKLPTYANLQGPNSANPPTTRVNKRILGPDGKLKPEECKCHRENNHCMMSRKTAQTTTTCTTTTERRTSNPHYPPLSRK